MLLLEKQLQSKIKSNIFTGFTYSRTVACCGYLASNQKVSFTQHIKKVIVKHCSFTLRSKITDNK